MSTRIFASPRRYVQGNRVLQELGQHLAPLGKRALLIADDIVWGLVGQPVQQALKGQVEFKRERFTGEATSSEVTRLARIAAEAGSQVIVGLGGGKTLDTAKAVADECTLPVAIVPTIASTDAPCSALSVLYTEAGTFDKYRFYRKNPDLVLIDSQVCAQAPVRLFASGIADGLATYVEAAAVLRSNAKSMVGGAPTIAGMAIAAACEKTLFAYGLSAYHAVARKLVTPAVEAVIEANTLLSGLGFENGGLAGAHAIHDGFTALHGDIHRLTHGEKVAYGTLVHMILEAHDEADMARYVRFFRAIKMPTTLAELHIETASYEDLLKVGELANSEQDTLRNLRADLTAAEVADAILAADAFSKSVA